MSPDDPLMPQDDAAPLPDDIADDALLALEDDTPAADAQSETEGDGGEDNEDDESEESGDQSGDKKSGGGGKKVGGRKTEHEQELEDTLLSEEDLSAYDSETLIEKLKLLAWAPFSTLIPGASAFDSENDLKRKLFLNEIGIHTRDLEGIDIADPDLIKKLEARLHDRQAQARQDAQNNIAVPAAGLAAAAGAAAGAAGAVGLAAVPPLPTSAPDPVADTALQKREEEREIRLADAKPGASELDIKLKNDAADAAHLSEVQRAEKAAHDRLMQYQTVAPDNDQSGQNARFLMAADLMTQDSPFLQQPVPQQEPSFAEELETSAPPVQPRQDDVDIPAPAASASTSITEIGALFNATASQTYADQPMGQKVDFKVQDPAPKVDLGSGMM